MKVLAFFMVYLLIGVGCLLATFVRIYFALEDPETKEEMENFAEIGQTWAGKIPAWAVGMCAMVVIWPIMFPLFMYASRKE